MTDETSAPDLHAAQSLLRECRSWILGVYPQTHQEDLDREAMIQRIDAVAPPLPESPFVPCVKNKYCAMASGHSGDCDDLPF